MQVSSLIEHFTWCSQTVFHFCRTIQHRNTLFYFLGFSKRFLGCFIFTKYFICLRTLTGEKGLWQSANRIVKYSIFSIMLTFWPEGRRLCHNGTVQCLCPLRFIVFQPVGLDFLLFFAFEYKKKRWPFVEHLTVWFILWGTLSMSMFDGNPLVLKIPCNQSWTQGNFLTLWWC